MKHPDSGTLGRRAFSLPELVAVLAIVALLGSLLLPAMARAKDLAARVQCIGNHRRVALGWILYSADYQDSLVWTVDDGDDYRFTNWVAGHLRRPDEQLDSKLLVDLRRSLLAPYVERPELYKCPSDPTMFARSISMNNRLNPVRIVGEVLGVGGLGTNFMVYRRQSHIGRPSSIFVTLDERHDSINEANFACDLSNTGSLDGDGAQSPFWWLDTPASYHTKGLVLDFADGHVEHHRWRVPTTLGPIGTTGFRWTSRSDVDIQWLQERAAEPRLY